tara:strand:- start:89 stop:358 length:270 start_codon:yes stop_codon:yes gene_type:complete
MYGRVILPANPNHNREESLDELKSCLKELEKDFVMKDYYTNPENVNEYIVVGESDLFEKEFGLHHLIAMDNGSTEFWLVKNHNESYESM